MNRQQPNNTASITAKIARSFFLLALLTISMVGIVAYVGGRNALRQAAFSRLTMTATLKEKEISRWLVSCEEDFLLIAEFPTVREDIRTLLETSSETLEHQAAYQRLGAYFAEISKKKPKFTEISLQNRANQILLSTDPKLEGTYEISTNLTEVDTIVPGETFTPIFYVSPETGEPAITYATKVFDATGDRQGMILANLNLKRIDDIISERTGLDKTDETYLVGSLASKTAFISRDDTARDFPQGPHSQGIDAAFRGENGAALYDNYRGQRVLGVYSWLADQDIALLAEISEAEAFAPARRLATTIMLVGIGAAGILSFGVSRLAHQLSESRKQIESYSDRLEKTAAAANAANRTKSEFLANMSHELRTPLNAILGFTQMMQRESDRNSDQHEYLGIISRSGEHLLNLINDVLSMAKIEAGRTVFEPNTFDLHHLLRTLEETLRIKAEEKSLQLFVKVQRNVPQFIKTDEMKLRQVLVNLLSNAIKFTQAGQITLTVSLGEALGSSEFTESVESVNSEESPKYLKSQTTTSQSVAYQHILFTLQDTGLGIDPSELPRLFDPFYQSSKTKKAHQGAGLGLAISQRFVQLMGGTLQVQSQPHQGATFSFQIRAVPSASHELAAAPNNEVLCLALGQSAYRILVVEDIASSRKLLVSLLSLVGFEVQAAVNGEKAIAVYQAWHPHLIWMDMRMPVMDGYEATQRIRALELQQKKQQPIKIIALTASAFEEERAAVLASGCNDFVRKPFHTHIIFLKMAEHLGVQYLYKDSSPNQIQNQTQNHAQNRPQDRTQPEAALLQPEDLTVMSANWLSQFHQAAIQVDAEELEQLIKQIPAEYNQLATALSTSAKNFCFDELIALTKSALSIVDSPETDSASTSLAKI
jgi:signal transduction histidine kinase/DNA-binding response OmpR family regulator